MSSKKRKWKFRIRHILEAVTKIQQYVQGMDFIEFCGDSKTVDAVVRNLFILGEATRHIPPEIEEAYPEVPWVEMRAMRNIVAHEYDRVDMGLVWDTIRTDLPPLVASLEAVVEIEGPDE